MLKFTRPPLPTAEEFKAYKLQELRDQFAGQALMGYLSGRNSARTPEEWADLAWQAAEAMIASRDKVQPK